MSAILVGDLRIKLAEQAVKTLVDDDRASLKASFMVMKLKSCGHYILTKPITMLRINNFFFPFVVLLVIEGSQHITFVLYPNKLN